MTEKKFSSFDDLSGKQMAALCRLCGLDSEKDTNIPGLLAELAAECVHITVAARFMKKKGYVAYALSHGVCAFLVVSKEVMPANLRQQQRELLKRDFEIDRDGELYMGEKNHVKEMIKDLKNELKKLPAYYCLWFQA
jgi:hypothetical protein